MRLASMLVAELAFALPRPPPAMATQKVESLLGAWHKNGQIVDDWQLIETPDHVLVFTLLPDADSIDPRHDNRYATGALTDLAAGGVARPIIAIRGASADVRPGCTCLQSESLIFFTSMFCKASPIRCGTCFGPVPLYRLPHTHDFEHLNVLSWAADYRACDTLQTHCTTGERFAEGQLFLYDSSLNRNGREIARTLAQIARLPVYYYLFKARGRSQSDELRRTCPACRSAWRLTAPWHGLFEFRCDACGLLSNIACSLAR